MNGASSAVSASETRLTLPAPHETLAEPAVRSVARDVGSRLEADALQADVTPDRIEILDQTTTVYQKAGLEGARARTSMWLATEKDIWQADQDRVSRHLQKAERLESGIEGSILSPLELGAVPGTIDQLRVDRRVMVAHLGGNDQAERVQEIEAAISDLRRVHADGTMMNLAGTFGLNLLVIGAVYLVGRPLQKLEQDVQDLEISVRGIPP